MWARVVGMVTRVGLEEGAKERIDLKIIKIKID